MRHAGLERRLGGGAAVAGAVVEIGAAGGAEAGAVGPAQRLDRQGGDDILAQGLAKVQDMVLVDGKASSFSGVGERPAARDVDRGLELLGEVDVHVAVAVVEAARAGQGRPSASTWPRARMPVLVRSMRTCPPSTTAVDLGVEPQRARRIEVVFARGADRALE